MKLRLPAIFWGSNFPPNYLGRTARLPNPWRRTKVTEAQKQENDNGIEDFISDTLLAIDQGVQQAIQRRDPNSYARFNPVWNDRSDKTWLDYVQKIDFDVAVTVLEKNNKDGKGSIKVAGIVEFGGGASHADERSTVSRIKLIIPMLLAGQSTVSTV
jgi:hypothetical protein